MSRRLTLQIIAGSATWAFVTCESDNKNGREGNATTTASPAADTASATTTAQVVSPTSAAIGSQASRGRLVARPTTSTQADGEPETGLRQLGLNEQRDGFLYVPEGYRPEQPASLVVMLHGAGGEGRGGMKPYLSAADERGLILVSPTSQQPTWDVIRGGFGPDVELIDRALDQVFSKYVVNPDVVAIAGFSDGASYALSLGLTNGDLFRHIIAFSPGFSAPDDERGKPRIFISHGTQDEVLPIDRCSRRIVPELQDEGYDVVYREFDGPHTIPPEIIDQSLEWLATHTS